MDYSLAGSSVQWDYTSKNAEVGCHFLLQEIFLTKGSNLSLLRLLHWQALTTSTIWEKEMAAHSSMLAWGIPGTEEPGGLLSVGSPRIGHG